MFVSPTTAQRLSFASKIATGLVIPQIASFMSLYSAQMALQIAFFSSPTGTMAVLLDARFWRHAKFVPNFTTKVTSRTWITIITTAMLWAVILTSDLLVFQLAKRQPMWRAHSHSKAMDPGFNTTSLRIATDFSVVVPSVLINSTEASNVFGNKTYFPGEYYEYLTMSSLKRVQHTNVTDTKTNSTYSYELVYDVENVTAANSNADGENFTCNCAQKVSQSQVSLGLPVVWLNCHNNDTPTDDPYTPSVGFNNPTNVLAYQGIDGAHFSFMTGMQRDRQVFNEGNNTSPIKTFEYLNSSTTNYTLISQQINGSSTEVDLDAASAFLSQWKNGTENYDVILMYHKIENELLYDRIPKTTLRYLIIQLTALAGTQDPDAYTSDPYSVAPLVYFKFISYYVQNVKVPGKSIDPRYLGIDANFAYGPRSTSILTDLSPEHVIISMLKNPLRPTLVKYSEQMDPWPALILIIASLSLCFVLYMCQLYFRLSMSLAGSRSGIKIPFDPVLELFHSALDNFNHRTVDSLLLKIQDTDLIMINGYVPDLRANKIGLFPDRTVVLPLNDRYKYR